MTAAREEISALQPLKDRTMPTPRFFVSIDDQNRPLSQRTSLKARPYLSASYYGDSFSSTPPNGQYPRKVVLLEKAVEWVARATLPDGSKVSIRSKSSVPARNFVRYTYITNPWDVKRNGDEPKREAREEWTSQTREDWEARVAQSGGLAFELQEFAVGDSLEVRNWPTAGDSIVLPDDVRSLADRTNPHGYPPATPFHQGEADNPDAS